MKLCAKCGQERPLEDFHKLSRAKDGLQPKCKTCGIAAMQAWKLSNPEKYKEMNRSRRRNLAKHGFTEAEWDDILESIDNKCQICGQDMEKPYVDHDHTTGLVRGALCTHCNRGLGAFYDNPELLEKAIEFLKSPPLGGRQIFSRHSMKSETPHGWLPGRPPRSK
jgi:DNA-directed RNA polymerase subunit M/transcription elongation factor TFIIS